MAALLRQLTSVPAESNEVGLPISTPTVVKKGITMKVYESNILTFARRPTDKTNVCR
jgi:hypothetical protein